MWVIVTDMNNAVPFDTLYFANQLKIAGVPEKQAEKHAELIAQAINIQLVTKNDIDFLESKIIMKLTRNVGIMMTTGLSILGYFLKQ